MTASLASQSAGNLSALHDALEADLDIQSLMMELGGEPGNEPTLSAASLVGSGSVSGAAEPAEPPMSYRGLLGELPATESVAADLPQQQHQAAVPVVIMLDRTSKPKQKEREIDVLRSVVLPHLRSLAEQFPNDPEAALKAACQEPWGARRPPLELPDSCCYFVASTDLSDFGFYGGGFSAFRANRIEGVSCSSLPVLPVPTVQLHAGSGVLDLMYPEGGRDSFTIFPGHRYPQLLYRVMHCTVLCSCCTAA